MHPPLVANSIFHPLLEEGTRYWIAASVAQYVTRPGVYAGWQWNPSGDTGPFAYRETGINHWFVNPGGNPRGVYRVEGVPTVAFAGKPRSPNCHGKSVSALARQFGGLDAAAAALGFPSVPALQNAIGEFCRG